MQRPLLASCYTLIRNGQACFLINMQYRLRKGGIMGDLKKGEDTFNLSVAVTAAGVVLGTNASRNLS